MGKLIADIINTKKDIITKYKDIVNVANKYDDNKINELFIIKSANLLDKEKENKDENR